MGGGTPGNMFIEDSIMLCGSQSSISAFADLMEAGSTMLPFGGQLTFDVALSRMAGIERLSAVGLRYLFFGLETADPLEIGGINKDRKRDGSWLQRAEAVLEAITKLGIGSGVSLLFGMGESRESRVKLFRQLEQWRSNFGQPAYISMNWAVQHPMSGFDRGANYSYTEWGTSDEEFIAAFKDFGEASVRYPMAGQPQPQLVEVREVAAMRRALIEK